MSTDKKKNKNASTRASDSKLGKNRGDEHRDSPPNSLRNVKNGSKGKSKESIQVFFDANKQTFYMISESRVSSVERAFIWRDPSAKGTSRGIIPSKDIAVEENRITVHLPFQAGENVMKAGKYMVRGKILKVHLKVKTSLKDARTQAKEYQPGPGTSPEGGVGG